MQIREANFEELQQALKDLKEKKELEEKKQKLQQVEEVFKRCQGHQYLKYTNKSEDCFTYRKVSNLRKYSLQSENDSNICDVHEEIFLCIRPDSGDEWDFFGVGQSTNFSISTYKEKKHGENFVQYDIPCSEEEYLNVKNYVTQMSENFLKFREMTNLIFDKQVGLK